MTPAAVRNLLRTTPTAAPVANRSLLYVSGSQATVFLNGILASTVPSPPRGPFFSAFLHAQGRVTHDVFLYPKPNAKGHDGYLIEFDARPSEAPSLLQTLKRFVLRSKVKIEDVSNQYDVWSVWGSERMMNIETKREWQRARSGVIEPIWDSSAEWPWKNGNDDRLSLFDRRAVGMGCRMLVPKGDKPSEVSTHDVADTEEYTLHRILHGVPEGIIDIPPMQAFPMESNLDIMGGLDFRKGCYVGQELTVRTFHTGVLRKRILPVILSKPTSEAENSDAPGSESEFRLTTSDGSRPRVRGTGRLLSTTQGVGLALVRLEQVSLVERMGFEFQTETGWKVQHWWPDWWPEESEHAERRRSPTIHIDNKTWY